MVRGSLCCIDVWLYKRLGIAWVWAAHSMNKLARGKACMNCRERRTKCDGVQPTCRRCSNRGLVCTYIKEKKAKKLERDAAELESRVLDLETQRAKAKDLLQLPPTPLIDPTLIPYNWWSYEEPPNPLRTSLFNIFLRFSPTLGFFLSNQRFTSSFHASAPFGHFTRPSPALLSAVYLWGIALSSSDTLMSHEDLFVSRALYHMSNAPMTNHPQRAKHLIQAELLISQYFFKSGHFAEGKAHSDTAMSIALSHHAHKIRGFQPLVSGPPLDTIEQGERINSFWAAYLVDKCWSVAAGLPSACPDQNSEVGRIDSPWPSDMVQYERFPSPIVTTQLGTIQRFLSSLVWSYANEETSFFAMRCQAACLLEEASHFSAAWSPHFTDEQKATFERGFVSLNQKLDSFTNSISPIVVDGINISRTCQLVFVHSLARLATISLNTPSTSTRKSVIAALETVHLLDEVDVGVLRFVNPIMGSLWSTCGRVLCADVIRIRAQQTVSDDELSHEQELLSMLDRLSFLMLALSHHCNYIGSQHTILEVNRQSLITN